MTLPEAYRLAVDHHLAGRLHDAEQLYRQILATVPDQPETLHMLGLIAYAVGQPIVAIELIEKALARNPNIPGALTNLGEAQRVAGRLDDAISTFQRAVAREPDAPETYNNLGLALDASGRAEDALAAFAKALSLKPQFAACMSNRANALARLNRFDEALAEHRRAVEADPRYAIGFNNFGSTLEQCEQFGQAELAYRRAVAIDPNFAEAWNNLGSLVRRTARFDDAIACFERAIAINPNHAGAGWNAGLVYLTRGDFARGWPLYERRFLVPGLQPTRDFTQPRWDGTPIAPGKTLFLHAEQGFGDMIQAARFLPQVVAHKSSGSKLMVEVHRELIDLFRSIDGIDELIEVGQTPPTFDVVAPIFSLMGILDVRLDAIPANVPYLRTDLSRVEAFRSRLGESSNRRIGLVWRGSASHQNDRDRSLPVEALTPLASMHGVDWISLQKGLAPDAAKPALPLIDFTDDLNDFSDTASLIESLDLVLTVDTSVAHLAGALGKPVWLMIPMSPDWRWLLDRSDSPWYPTMRIFRQTKFRDWTDTIASISVELSRPR